MLRDGARTLLAQAVEAEVAEFLAKYAGLKTQDVRARVVRHGHLPEREVVTGIGPVAVRQPRVRDREANAENVERIRFAPAILPPYPQRSRSPEVLIPILYLKGTSTSDFEEALAALLGKDAPGLSASTIGRLREAWIDEQNRWKKRDLSGRRYVYVWADGIYLQARLEDDAVGRSFRRHLHDQDLLRHARSVAQAAARQEGLYADGAGADRRATAYKRLGERHPQPRYPTQGLCWHSLRHRARLPRRLPRADEDLHQAVHPLLGLSGKPARRAPAAHSHPIPIEPLARRLAPVARVR